MNSYVYEVENLSNKEISEIVKFKLQKDVFLRVIIKNTRGITSKDLELIKGLKNIEFQIKGCYNDEYLQTYNNIDYIKTQNVYSKGDFIDINNAIYDIEDNFNKYLKPLPKVYMIYDFLRTNYSVDYFSKINDLRILITKKGNALALAKLMKEFLDRENIPNKLIMMTDQIGGYNLIKIGKYYYILDLASDCYAYNNNIYSDINGFSNFKDVNLIIKRIEPLEKISSLKGITLLDKNTINILKNLTIPRAHNIIYRKIRRKDTGTLVIAQLEKDKYMPNDLYRYLISDIYQDNRLSNVKVFYSKTDFFKLEDEELNDLSNTYFERERIEKLYSSKIYNFGYIENNLIYSDTDEYTKNIKIKSYTKNNKDLLVLEKTFSSNLYFYNYFEIYFDKQICLYQGEIVCSNDIFKYPKNYDQIITNSYLKLDKLIYRDKYLDGFMGYFDPDRMNNNEE